MIDTHNLAPLDTWLIIGIVVYLLVLNWDRSKDIKELEKLWKRDRDADAATRVRVAHLERAVQRLYSERAHQEPPEEPRYGGHLHEVPEIEDHRPGKPH